MLTAILLTVLFLLPAAALKQSDGDRASCRKSMVLRLSPPRDVGKYVSRIVEVRGNSMMPLMAPGAELWLLKDYYMSNKVERYDVIAYHYAGRRSPLVKMVRGVPGDRWEVEEKAGVLEIIVNGRRLINSAGSKYQVPKTGRLPLYAKTCPVIPEDVFLILGDEPGGGLDSTQFGLVHRRDFAGRLVFGQKSNP